LAHAATSLILLGQQALFARVGAASIDVSQIWSATTLAIDSNIWRAIHSHFPSRAKVTTESNSEAAAAHLRHCRLVFVEVMATGNNTL
jgi:hypothetical protein